MSCAAHGDGKGPTGAAPVPDSGTMCGLPSALSVIASDADRAPAAAGRNATGIAQRAPAATAAPRNAALTIVNSEACGPQTVTVPIPRDPVPVLRAGRARGRRAIQRARRANVRLDGL